MKENISYEHAEALYESEDFSQALEMFMRLENAQEDFDIQNYIGCCLLKLEKYSESKRVFQKIIEKNPSWSRPVYNLGRVYMALNEFNKALMYFNSAVMINQYDADAYYYLGVCFEKMKNYKNAIQNYKKSIKINPNEFEPYMGLSTCYGIIGNIEDALKAAKKAFYIFDCNDTLYNYTYLLIKSKKYTVAVSLLEKHNVMASNDSGLINNLKFCLKKLNQSCEFYN